jgi:light-regulated signal transduction histidine kinase (bacteriophytochrome)
MKTDKSKMDGLFDKFAELLAETLEQGKAVVNKETGELERVTPDAATLNVVRQFLKDTGTVLQPGTSHEAVERLRNRDLPFNGEEYEEGHVH